MKRERVLKVVLVVLGLLFCAAIYPLMLMAKQDPALAMMMSLYATLGVFLLLAARNPSEHRSLIAFTAGSSLVHGWIMTAQALGSSMEHGHLLGDVPALLVVGIALIVLAPAKQSAAKAMATHG